MRVLLVEDDTSTAKSIELMLKTEGFIVDTTDLGEDGLEIGKLYDYDIIILDLMLPDIDGYEVLKRLRASKVDTPILILSGLSEMDSKIKGVAISVASNYIAVGTEGGLHQFLLTDAPFIFVPVQPKQAGARATLERLGTENVHNVFMNYDGGCLLVEGALDGQCYDLEGKLLWSCPKIDAKKLQQALEALKKQS